MYKRSLYISITSLILIVGILSFINKREEDPQSFEVNPTGQGFSLSTDVNTSPRDEFMSRIKKYPDPGIFRRISFKNGIASFSDTCEDKYIVAIVYNKDVDYRDNPEMAIVNKAFECVKGNQFNGHIEFKALDAEGYLIVANQGNGEWYNPR